MSEPTTISDSPSSGQPPPRLAVQAFWLTLSKVVGVVFHLLLPMIVARALSRNEFGLYRQVFLYSATAVSISTLGVGASAYYFIPRKPERGGTISFNIIVYNVVAGGLILLVLLLWPQVLAEVLRVPQLQPYAIAIGVLIAVMMVATYLEVVPTSLQDVKGSTILIIGTQFFRAVAFLAAALIHPSVKSLLVAGIAQLTFQCGILFWYLRKKFGQFWSGFDGPLFREQLAYALPLGAFGLITIVQRDLHNYFVSATFSPAEFAIYSVGCLQAPLLPAIIDSVAAVMAIRISALQQERRHRDILYLTASAMTRLAAIQFPVAALLFVARRDTIVLLYTAAYESSADIFAINTLLLPLAAFVIDPLTRAYVEIRRYMLTVRIMVGAALVLSLYFAIRQMGLVGAIAASVAAAYLERAALCWKFSQVLDIRWKDLLLFRDMARVGAAAVAAALVASLARNAMSPEHVLLRLLATGGTFTAIYLAEMHLFRLPGVAELSPQRVSGFVNKAIARMRGA